MHMHTKPDLFLYNVGCLFFQVMLGIPLLEGTNPAACFPRYVIGCNAVCYSYIWSEVWIKDTPVCYNLAIMLFLFNYGLK